MRHLQYEKQCIYCNKNFTATRIDAKYCSDACNAAFRRNKITMAEGGLVPALEFPKAKEVYFTCSLCNKTKLHREKAVFTNEGKEICKQCAEILIT